MKKDLQISGKREGPFSCPLIVLTGLEDISKLMVIFKAPQRMLFKWGVTPFLTERWVGSDAALEKKAKNATANDLLYVSC